MLTVIQKRAQKEQANEQLSYKGETLVETLIILLMKGIAIVLILSFSVNALRTEGKQSFLQQDDMAGET